MEPRVVEVVLPNGVTALMEATDADGTGATKVRFADQFDLAHVLDTLEGLSEAIRSAVDKASPDKVIVELGMKLAIKAGKLTGLVVEGQGKGSLQVTLEWKRGRRKP